jgi:hypothetical protein
LILLSDAANARIIVVDYVEGAGTMHEIFNYTLSSFSPTEVRLHRQYINSTLTQGPGGNSTQFKSVDLYLSIPPTSLARLSVRPGHNGTFTPPTIDIVLPPTESSPLNSSSVLALPKPPVVADNIVRVRVVTNETSLVGFDPDSLFLSPQEASDPAINTAITSLPANISEQVRNPQFFWVIDFRLTLNARFLSWHSKKSSLLADGDS